MGRAALVLCSVLVGCTYKAATKIVDPVLVSEGTLLDRSEGSLRSFVLGDYRFERVSLDRDASAPSTGLSPDGQARPTERIDLQMTMMANDRRWGGACRALREPTGRADYAAVTEEFHDVVQIDCTFDDGAGATWIFEMKGSLAANLGGMLTPTHASVVGGGLEVEVLMWKNLWKRVRRHLPDPVAQVRLQRGTVAAMILERPERAWIDPSTPAEMLDVAMATLGALRMLPLDFDA